MNQSKAENMVARLLSNAAGLQYGAVTVTAKVYNGKIAQVLFSTTENLKEPEEKIEPQEEGQQ